VASNIPGVFARTRALSNPAEVRWFAPVETFTRQESSMDIAFLLLTAALSAVTIVLIFGIERLRNSK
jgi:hypothetical protein